MHFPSHYHEKHSQQVEQLRSEMQTFQNNALSKMQEIEKSIERDRSRIYDTYTSVPQIKNELRQVHKLIDALVTHLLMPDLPIQKIREAVTAITNYHEVLQKRRESFDDMQRALATEITQLSSALTALVSPPQQNTDGLLKSALSPLVEYEKEYSSNEMELE